MRSVLATLLLVTSTISAAAVQVPTPDLGTVKSGDVSAAVTLMPGATNPVSAAARAGNTVSVLEFATKGTTQAQLCNGSTNVAPQVNAAVAAGYRRVFLPKNCLYVPDLNTTPADTEIFGEDWKTSIVSVANRATDQLMTGPRGRLSNVAIESLFCDQVAVPENTQKLCPVANVVNQSDQANPVTNWAYAWLNVTAGPAVTGPGGVSSHDSQILGLNSSLPGGDVVYLGAQGAGTSGARIVNTGTNDYGVYLFSDLNRNAGTPSKAVHNPLLILEYGAYLQTAASAHITRGSNAQSLLIDDLIEPASMLNNSNIISVGLNYQYTGTIFNAYQGTNPFIGNVLYAKMGNAGGAFTGLFAALDNNGTRAFSVDAFGNIFTNGTVYSNGNITSKALVVGSGLATGNGTATTTVVDGNQNATFKVLTVSGGSALGRVNLNDLVKLNTVTVANLLPCNSTNLGGMETVYDAASPAWNAIVTGGGATPEPVFCDGSVWRVH